MRTAPICMPVKCLALSFIRINELPQISESKTNSNQLVKFCLAIVCAKVHKFTFDELNFIMSTLSELSTRAPKELDKKETKAATENLLAELNELQNVLYAES